MDRHMIFCTAFGSHLYGTNTPASDLDYKAVSLPTSDEILLMKDFGVEKQGTASKGHGVRNTSDDVDFDVYSLKKFTSMLAKGEVVALDMLFSYGNIDTGASWPWFEKLWQGREHFLTKNTHTFAGYCMQQAAKYGLVGSRCRAALDALGEIGDCLTEMPHATVHHMWSEQGKTAEAWMAEQPFAEYMEIIEHKVGPLLSILGKKFSFGARLDHVHAVLTKVADGYGDRVKRAHDNQGIDWKALSHALRVCIEAHELLTTGHITLPLKEPDRRLVMRLKEGQLDIDTALGLVSDHLSILRSAAVTSTLRDEPDRAWLDDFVKEAHLSVVRGRALP